MATTVRLAYVYDAVHPDETGGVQRRVWELSRRLSDDHDVHWFGLRYWDGDAVIEREGVTIHGVASPGRRYVAGRRSIAGAMRYSARLVRPLLREGFDVIDCQQFPYFPAFPSKLGAARHGASLALTWHEVWGDYWYDYLGRTGWVGRTVEGLTARLPDAHLAVSEHTAAAAAELSGDAVAVVPNGIALAAVEATPAAEEPVDVAFVGRLIPEKQVDLLVRAVHRLRDDRPDLTCAIVGEGPEAARIDRLIAELDLGDRVTLRPFLDEHADILGLLKAAGVFVLPSRREGFGMAALEALACGTPVVTVDHPRNAAVELVDDGVTGLVVPDTVDGIAGGIDRAGELDGGACIEAASGYDWDPIAERAEAVYRDLASR